MKLINRFGSLTWWAPAIVMMLIATGSMIASAESCASLNASISALKAEHASIGAELAETNRKLQACLLAHSEEQIQEGICANWEATMANLRAEQERIFVQVRAMQAKLATCTNP